MTVRTLARHATAAVLTCVLALPAFGDSHMKEAAKTPAKEKPAAAAAGQAKAGDTKPGAAQDEMTKMMEMAAKPGPEHEWLGSGKGKYKAVVKSWFAPGEPTVSEGTAEFTPILGGRYLEQRFNGVMMGQPFEGYGVTGFDNLKKEYWSFWIDNMSTGMMTSTGTADEGRKVLTMNGMSPGPDGKPMPLKTVLKLVDDTTQTFSMFGNMDGKEQLMMEITYTKM